MAMRNIWIVYRKELTEALRDRRTLITTFLVPGANGPGVAGVVRIDQTLPVLAQARK